MFFIIEALNGRVLLEFSFAYLRIPDSEKLGCHLCILINLHSKSCSIVKQITSQPLCVVQQAVGFGTSRLSIQKRSIAVKSISFK